MNAADLDFDPDRLQGFLGQQVTDVERIGGGQSNPTYFVTVGGDECVLRKKPNGELAPSAHDVGREYRIMQALSATPVPVPAMRAYCDDESVLGTAFYVMSRLRGRVLDQALLPDVPIADRTALYRAQAETLAALHAVDWEGVGLGSLARPGDFLGRQVERWARAWDDERPDDVGRVSDWLRANQPAERRTLTHGDFKFNNLIYDAGSPAVIGVLDWELAAIGDPMFDLGHVWAATWGVSPDEYGGVWGVDLDAEGLPTGEQFARWYQQASGRDDELLPFHRVLGLFRYAGIFRGIGQRAAAGTASAADAEAEGDKAHVFLDRTLRLLG